MNKHLLFRLISLCFISSTQAQTFNYFPASTTNIVIQHTYYTLSYSVPHKQAEWVAYMLTKDNLINGTTERKDNFRPDSLITLGSATLADYAGSGYDRGHLAPVADMKINFKAMNETFFLSNISPQKPDFNQKIWEKLEEQVRSWAKEYDTLYIATGGALKYPIDTIGAGNVTVPGYFYKVILNSSSKEKKAIAFVLPNEKGTKELKQYVVSIDSVEKLTGIDFFPALPDSTEKRLEGRADLTNWSFDIVSGTSSSSDTIPCKGITNEGVRCKKYTDNKNGYCEFHQKQIGIVDMSIVKENRRTAAVKCSGLWKDGTACKRMTYSPNGKCWEHGGD
jgi:endonuclease G, mitochondrial